MKISRKLTYCVRAVFLSLFLCAIHVHCNIAIVVAQATVLPTSVKFASNYLDG